METTPTLPALVGAVADLHGKQEQVKADLAAMPARERLLRLPEVEFRCAIRKSTIYALQAKGEFPAAVLCGARSVAWKESDIDAWIRSRTERVTSQGAAQ